MNEGRAELQSVILQYEKQRAEAIRSKQEAEIVLPFLRAALEELDDALGQREKDVSEQDVQSRVKRGAASQAKAEEPQRPETDFRFEAASQGAEEPEAEMDVDVDDEPAAKPSFGRGSIAALLDEEDSERTGTR